MKLITTFIALGLLAATVSSAPMLSEMEDKRDIETLHGGSDDKGGTDHSKFIKWGKPGIETSDDKDGSDDKGGTDHGKFIKWGKGR